MSGIAIIGAGGHGRVIASVLQAANVPVAGFIDSGVKGELPFPLLGSDEDIPNLMSQGTISSFIIGLGSIKGGPSLRAELFDKMIDYGLTPAVAIHPMAIFSPGVKIGAGCAVMAGVVVNTGTSIGKNSIINTGVIIDHDGNIGEHVHIAPGVTLSGNVTIGNHSLIGVGSTIRQGIKVGKNVTLGAGSVAVKNIEDEKTAFGNPAKPH